uniref:Acyl-CoA thioesterase II n=1 Tax=Caenorhabditis japonica TaxID=281687 RepID=A0A8R1DUX4_CAEJA
MASIPRKSEFIKVENYEPIAKRFFEFSEAEKDCFSTSILSNGRQANHRAAYGGLIFSQALAAAEKTVETAFKPHSMHSYFIFNVDTKVPISYNVRRTRDGRSFVTRTVEAVQKGAVCFVLQCSFHVEERDSIIHQSIMPKVPAPEVLMSMRDAVPYIKELVEKGEVTPTASMLRRLQKYDTQVYTDNEDLFEMRSTNLGNYYGFASDQKAEVQFWMRARGDLSDDERLHRWLLAYNTDSLLITTAVSPHYASGFQASMIFSLDHSVWFHRAQVKADDWLLFDCTSHIASGSRAFIEGRIWRRDGVLIASCHQEALVRTKAGEPSRL